MLNYTQLLEELRLRSGSGAKYGLERMRALVEAMGHPEERFRSVLVAGTNGKGSVCSMLEAIALAAGLRVGLNTSPHLNRVTERIRINGHEISQDEMVEAYAAVVTAMAKTQLEATFFEVMTCMAFWVCAQQQVEFAVFEVGLGGRLDATNVLPCDVSAVVSIGFDHTSILGSTLDAIAREKAQIARPRRPLVIGSLSAEPMAAVRQEAARIGARVVLVDDYRILGKSQQLQHPRGCVALSSNLDGEHQLDNAAVAACVACEAGIDINAIEQGLSQAHWRARLERIEFAGRHYIVDGAHNVDGADALGKALHGTLQDFDLVIATSGSRDTGAFVEKLCESVGWPRQIRVCQPRGHRLSPAAEVEQRIAKVLAGRSDLRVCADVSKALLDAQAADVCLVTGSLYLAGEVLSIIGSEARDDFDTGQ